MRSSKKRPASPRKLLGHFTGPIAYMIEAAAVVSAVIGHWGDFAIITGAAVLQCGARILAGPQGVRMRWPRSRRGSRPKRR